MTATIRAGVNTAISVTTSPVKIWPGDPIKGGPTVQNTGASADIVFIWQGNDEAGVSPPTTASPAFELQSMALLTFEGAQQNQIYIWGSVATSATVNLAQ